MIRSSMLGGLVGFALATLLIGVLAISNGISADLYLPILVMGVPIIVIGLIVGQISGVANLRTAPRLSVRFLGAIAILLILIVFFRLTGVL